MKGRLMNIGNRCFKKISLDQWNKDTRLSTDAYAEIKLPKRATIGSAGYDFCSPVDFTLMPGEIIKVPTGIKACMWEDEFLMIVPRSSMGFKFFMRLANTVGIVDSDYFNNASNEGHIFIKVRNEGVEPMIVKAGEAIAQGIFMSFLETDDDDTKDEREGGFGSTSK